MQPNDSEGMLSRLLEHFFLNELLNNKYPQLTGKIGEILHKDYHEAETNSFLQQIALKAKKDFEEFENHLLESKLPIEGKKYGEILKDALRIAHPENNAIYQVPKTEKIRILLD